MEVKQIVAQTVSEHHIHASCFEFLTVGCALIPLPCMNSCVGTHLSNLNFAAVSLISWRVHSCRCWTCPKTHAEFSLSQVYLSCVCPRWQLLFRRAAGFCQHVQWQLIWKCLCICECVAEHCSFVWWGGGWTYGPLCSRPSGFLSGTYAVVVTKGSAVFVILVIFFESLFFLQFWTFSKHVHVVKTVLRLV